MNLLLTGPRDGGKSTVVTRALELLPEARAGGYLTKRIGPRAQPEGHLLRDLSGPERIIAHRDFTDGPRFGPFRVDLDAFETTGGAALKTARESADLIVADEIGRMEEGAQSFRAELMACLDSPRPFLAALSDRGGEVVQAILARDDVRVIEVTDASRAVLPTAIATLLRHDLFGAAAFDLPACTGVILAGGRGSRLSPDKGWLEVGDIAIVERAYAAIRPLVSQLLVAGDPEVAERLDAGWAADEISDVGPLAGIAGALRAAPAPTILVAAWDMPFLSPSLGAYMLGLAGDQRPRPREAGREEKRDGPGRGQALGWMRGFDAVAPRTDQGAEPLFAVYGRTCLEPARDILAAGGRRPQRLLEAVNTRWVEGPELAAFGDPEVLFFSANTPEDLEQAREIAASQARLREH